MAFVDLDLDLQILICTFLHPFDILILRKTCKTFQLVTRQRTIWVDALRRVCLENTLFIPSFPILDMSDVELEHAATAPGRWIELSTSSAARELSDREARLPPTTTRIIDDPFENKNTLILVPGGRYVVVFSESGFGFWDLGYTSSADCKLIASVGPEGGGFCGEVHATPDGMGLVICSFRPGERYSVYAIYPQSETPHLTKIACLELPPPYDHRTYLNNFVIPDKIIWSDLNMDETQGIIFRIWDYRLNASVSFEALVDDMNIGNYGVVATQTAIFILCEDEIFIWAVPPLLPQPLDFDDYSFAHSPPVITVKFPGGLALNPSLVTWRSMSSWYFDSSKPLYFDKVYSRHLELQRFKILIKPDFSDATLDFINAIRLTTRDFNLESLLEPMFCEDTLVYSWRSLHRRGLYSGSTLSLPTLEGNPFMTKTSLAVDRPDHSHGLRICPASGRVAYIETGSDTDKIVVLDFLPSQKPW